MIKDLICINKYMVRKFLGGTPTSATGELGCPIQFYLYRAK